MNDIIQANICGEKKNVLHVQLDAATSFYIPLEDQRQASYLATAINCFPALMAQLEHTANQLNLYAGPEELGSLTVVTESRRLLDNLKYHLQ